MALSAAVSTISMSQTLRTSFEGSAGILLCKVQQLFPLAANRGKRTIAQLESDYDGTGRGNGGAGHAMAKAKVKVKVAKEEVVVAVAEAVEEGAAK